jgi:DNA-binding MarR family transcriptional regulator
LKPTRKQERPGRQAPPTEGERLSLAGRASRALSRGNGGGSAQDIPTEDAKLRMFVADMYAAMSLLRLLRQEIASVLSLSSAEYSVLLAVWYLERGGDLTLRAIADHLHVAAPYVTAEVARLVDKGLLAKRPDAVDRRAVGVELTDPARELLAPLAPMLREVNGSLLAGVSIRELDSVHRFFKVIIANGYEAIGTARRFKVSDSNPTARRKSPPARRAPG